MHCEIPAFAGMTGYFKERKRKSVRDPRFRGDDNHVHTMLGFRGSRPLHISSGQPVAGTSDEASPSFFFPIYHILSTTYVEQIPYRKSEQLLRASQKRKNYIFDIFKTSP